MLAKDSSLVGIGMMSGTSADGIDAALVKIWGEGGQLRAKHIEGRSLEYPAGLRNRLLAASAPESSAVDEICSLHFEVGVFNAELAGEVIEAARGMGIGVDFISMHGQTVHHMGEARSLRSGLVTSTLQLGQPAVVALATEVTVISDLRAADIAAGGHGAPLTSFADAHLFSHGDSGAIVQNIGGIGNFTAIPPQESGLPVISFDTGPGNMLIDLVATRATNGRHTFDIDGRLARSGTCKHDLLDRLMKHPFLDMQPPRTTGREEFGEHYFLEVLGWSEAEGASHSDLAATMTEFTVQCIASSLSRFVSGNYHVKTAIVGGGGLRNPFLMERLRSALSGIRVITHEDVGLSSRFKECIAFAMLGAATIAGMAGNIPTCTGASRQVVLGSLTPGTNFETLCARSPEIKRAWLAGP